MNHKNDYSEILYQTSRWGDREPVHIRVTPKLLEFINEILGELTKRSGGILTLPSPYGIYRMEDISSILFQDIVPDAKTLPLGFHPDT